MAVYFGLFQLIAFVIYASKYASTMQKISRLQKLFLLDSFDKEKLTQQINRDQRRIRRLKRIHLLFMLSIFLIHLLDIYFSVYPIKQDYIEASVIFVIAWLLRFIITWMKGAGTIDNDPRIPGFFRF